MYTSPLLLAATLDSTALVPFTILLTLVAMLIIPMMRNVIHRKYPQSSAVESAALWNATGGFEFVSRLSDGELGEHPYVLYGVSSPVLGSYSILEVTLPTSSPIHTVCFNSKTTEVASAWQQILGDCFLEPVALEGMFSAHFNLYTSRQTQLEIRELFDPATMQYFMDFCSNFDFEIYQDSLLIATRTSQAANDSTDTFEDADKLTDVVIKQIKGWNYLQPAVPPQKYSPLKHFLGNPAKLKDKNYLRKP